MQNTIFRSSVNENHIINIKPTGSRIKITINGEVIAETTEALRLQEVGHSFYDPAIYVPKEDITADFVLMKKTTHCPHKGEASYFALASDPSVDLGWAYDTPIDQCASLAGRIAFRADRVTICEGTA